MFLILKALYEINCRILLRFGGVKYHISVLFASVTVIAISRIVAIIGDTALSCLNTLFMDTVQNVWLV
ncbi:MAG: hypothetical protein AMDU1_APLC00014G0059 [Thermoplasmatales archaeon A-plasma]|nr:MAG: hypothetical protein AMDU1_APLC00014G0059 [Thermoplasmatales archaeon A-plasma]